MKMNTLVNEYVIKEGQTDFDFVCGLPSPEDYGISALPNWNTTLWLVEKTNKGFKLRFGTPCPKNGGSLHLTIFTPQESVPFRRTKTSRAIHRKTKDS